MQAFRFGWRSHAYPCRSQWDIFVADSELGRIRVLRPAAMRPRRHLRLRRGPRSAVRDCLLSTRAEPAICLCGGEQPRRAFPYVNGMVAATSAPEMVVPDLPQGAGRCPARATGPVTSSFRPTGSRCTSRSAPIRMRRRRARTKPAAPRWWPTILTGQTAGCSPRALRNPVSTGVLADNGALWATNNERDELGDNLVPDFVTAWPGPILWLAVVLHRRESRSPPCSWLSGRATRR